ncbi:MAG: glucose-1-phosphate thymidylyltransferase RfbA [Deltaproteobacteria bacterium]|nr:glucose-1-phosphate thymidylyltransferase RfbA [Deltaproteobacteria bacterium]
MKRKGIILAGGSGTRLFPATIAVSKQLLPVFDKPMIFYPLSTLMLAKIQEILVITTPHDAPAFQKLLGTGENFGLQLSYAVQEKPEGLAQALIIAEEFLEGNLSALILGDNIFYGHEIVDLLTDAVETQWGATVFAYHVNDPQRYGVVEFGPDGKAIGLEEKPKEPRSNFAVTGLYLYDQKAPQLAKTLKPSARGELEITDLNRLYLERGELLVRVMGRGFAWLDTGTFDTLLEAGQFIHTIEKRQGMKIACLEEVAFRNGWIDRESLLRRARELSQNAYGKYLEALATSVGKSLF